jgi:hypothetical protein
MALNIESENMSAAKSGWPKIMAEAVKAKAQASGYRRKKAGYRLWRNVNG